MRRACPVCGTQLNGRTWHALLFEPLPLVMQRTIDMSPTDAITTKEVETCSEACMRVLDQWVDLRSERNTGRRRS